MTLPLFLFCDVSRYRTLPLNLPQAAAFEAEVLWLSIGARVSMDCVRLEIARRWEAQPIVPRSYIADKLREEIMAGHWPPAQVDTIAKADPAGSEWTQ